MNEPANLPPDAPRDPLLDALRERLGDYGAPPPPGAWAGIRQRLPAPVLPWWRRPRRLLPLLALLVLVGLSGYLLSLSGQLGGQPAVPLASHPARVPAQRLPGAEIPDGAAALPSTNQLDNEPIAAATQGTNAAAPRVWPNAATAPTPTTTPSAASPPSLAKAPLPAATKTAPLVAAADSRRSKGAARRAGTQLLAAESLRKSSANLHVTASRSATSRRARYPLATAAGATSQLRHRRNTVARLARLRHHVSGLNPQKKTTTPNAHSLAEPTDSEHTKANNLRIMAAQRHSTRPAGFLGSPPHLARRTRRYSGAAAHQTKRSAEATAAAESTVKETLTPLSAYPPWPPAARAEAAAPASLALHRADLLLLPPAALPASLATRPDSSPPARPVRRWALLATAGPTLSYRTIGAAPSALGTRPDLAHLERPALGFGAQVQVRRVLTGRWALAVGLGYQEYATRLALQVHDTLRVRQRDTYQLLTIPVQLSYALGTPRGHLAKALLLGAEVGWYRGGRSTEDNAGNYQQQTYTATATDSIYAAKTLALSLGFDLRYRLGGPASRWQWLVQPTARYVLTPFVQPNKAGFSPRQPFSLGLFTGFSWDIR